MTKTFKENFFRFLYLACAVFGIFSVLLITIYLFASGFPSIMEIGFFKFIFGTTWSPTTGEFGILPMIVNSIYVTALAVAIGVGVGVFGAVFMAKFCPKKLYNVLKQVINLLAGIPSVVFGFFGVQVIIPFFSNISESGIGYGLASSAIILGIMILPTVMSVSLNSLNNVPKSYYEGAVSLGATHEQAVFKVLLPAGKNGIMAGTILGIGRAIGETMAIVMVSGNIPKFAESFFQGIRTMTGNIVLEMGYAENLHLGALIGTGVVLFIFILIITLSLNIFNSEKRKMKSGNMGVFSFLKARLAIRNKTKSLRLNAQILKGMSFVAIGITMISLVSIIGFILIKGVPYLSFDLIFGKFEYGGPITLLPSIVSTLMIIGLTLIITVPIGVGTAIYLVEYTKKGSKFVKIVRSAVETLAGIPSIIYGIFGMMFFVRSMKMGYSLIAGCLTLVMMILPTIIRTTEQALLEVPDSYREGSLALGAGKTRTIFKVVLPSAISGIVTGIILSIGRIIGESAAVLFTVGSTRAMPSGYGSSGMSLAVFMYVLAGEGFHVNEAYATAVVLLVIVLALNLFSSIVEKLFKRRLSSNEKRKKSKATA